MNNIAIARRFRGMTAKALAEQIDVSFQQVGNWEQGLRNPNRTTAAEIARVLDVDAAWIMGCPQAMHLPDPLSGHLIPCSIMRCEEIYGYGMMYHLYLPDTGDIVAALHNVDVTFTTTDWQGQQPQNASEIAGYHWMDLRGNSAIMMDGLPRILA